MHSYATTTVQPRSIVIVDPQLRDYDALIERGSARLTTTASGLNALRLVPSHCDAVWFVNTTLPDMSGLQLLEMLRSLQPRLTVLLIDDHYAMQREQRALELGAAGYYCRPVPWEWIDACHGLAPATACCVNFPEALPPASSLANFSSN